MKKDLARDMRTARRAFVPANEKTGEPAHYVQLRSTKEPTPAKPEPRIPIRTR